MITPEQVAEYADKDSRALSKVSDKDLLEELTIRGTEYGSLPRVELIRNILNLGHNLERIYTESIND
jgi:hypothetical protein